MWLAEELAKQIDIDNMDDEEKIELAYQGLIMAVDGFELNKHKIFSRECAKNVYQVLKFNQKETMLEQYFENFSNKKDLIEAINIIENAKYELQQELFTENVSIEEISIKTGFEKHFIQKLMEIKEDIERKEKPESLDEITDKENESDEIDEDDINIIYPKGDNVESIVEKHLDNELLKSNLYDVLDTISEREKIVLMKIYKEGKNLREIGEEYDRSKETIRQRESKALRRLRWPSRREKLVGFATNKFFDNDNTEYEVTNYNNSEKKASISKDEIQFQEFATELLENSYIEEKQKEYIECSKKISELIELCDERPKDMTDEEYKKIKNYIHDLDRKKSNIYNEIETKMISIGKKYKIQNYYKYEKYFIENDLEKREELRSMALKIKLKRDLVEFKIPEKQRLQREYMELTKERNEKGDK